MDLDHTVRSLSRRRLLHLFGLAVASPVALSLAAACQPAPAAGPAPAAPAGGATPQPQQAAPGTASAAQVVVLQGVDANTLDPAFRNSTPEFNINAHIFNTHTWRDASTLKIIPEFVQEWKLVDDLTWE